MMMNRAVCRTACSLSRRRRALTASVVPRLTPATPVSLQSRSFFGWFTTSDKSPIVIAMETSLFESFNEASFVKVFDASDNNTSNNEKAPAGRYKVVLVSTEFKESDTDQAREKTIQSALKEPMQKHDVASATIETIALTPSEHETLVSKYSSPHEWIAQIAESQ